jgi:hypothetical protein
MEAGLRFKPYLLETLREPTGSPELMNSLTVALRISLSRSFKMSSGIPFLSPCPTLLIK